MKVEVRFRPNGNARWSPRNSECGVPATATSWTSCVAELDKVGPLLMHIPSCMPAHQAHQVVAQGAEEDELLSPLHPLTSSELSLLFFKNSESNAVGWIDLHRSNSNSEIGLLR